MFDCLITPDLRWRQWIVVIVMLLIVVFAVARMTSSLAEVLIGSTLVAITIGLTFGLVLYVGKTTAESLP
jgi:hypothetical protein